MDRYSRRRVLAASGTIVATAVAGCLGNGGGGGGGGDGGGDGGGGNGGGGNGGGDGGGGGGDGGGGNTVPGDQYPLVDRWLTETEIGGAASNYDGTLQDMRGQSSVSVDVGVEGNGGYYAFGPPAIVVAPGTEVTWEWTGRGQAHNVEAQPQEQLGESDYTFSSGQPVQSDTETFSQTLDSQGVALYHCDPHLALGMKGGVAVAPQ